MSIYIKRYSTVIITVLLCSFILKAQKYTYKIDSIYINNGMYRIADRIYGGGWLKFKGNIYFDQNYFFETYSKEFGLGSDDQMVLSRKETDELGYTHYRYFQKYKGLKVEATELIVHTRDSKAIGLNGQISQNININIYPFLSDKEAFEIAIEHVNKFLGNNKLYFTSPIKTELLILPEDDRSANVSAALAYRINLKSSNRQYNSFIYIDATMGAVVLENKISNNTNIPSTADTRYNGNGVSIISDYDPLIPIYILREDNGSGKNIITYNLNNTTNFPSATIYTNSSNYWTPADGAYDVHYSMEKAYDYFYSKFSRNSFDNSGAEIKSYVHYDNYVENASYDFIDPYTPLDDLFYFGDGVNNANPWTSIDIVGHEFTHGVIFFSAQFSFGFYPETRCLGEAFSDIFGTCIEAYSRNYNGFNWTIGEQVPHSPIVIVRDLENPKSVYYPNTFQGTNWTAGDEYNMSSPASHWFYLICMGGSGYVDDDPDNPCYNVKHIGIQNADRIAYYALTNYLSYVSKYRDMCYATIEAADILFGSYSIEKESVIEAWQAIGVYNPYTPYYKEYGSILDGGYQIKYPNNNYYIVSNNIFSPGTGFTSTNVCNNEYLIYRAGNEIDLQPGFWAMQGSFFKAHICSQSFVRSGSGETTDINDQITLPEIPNKPLNQETGLTVYPVPSKNFINLDIKKSIQEKADIFVYDYTGNIVFYTNTQDKNLKIDLSEKPDGLYIVKMVLPSGKVYMEKAVLTP